EYDFGAFFDGFGAIKDNIDMEHFKNEYVDMIYEALPDTAFAVKKEKVNVQNNSIKANKITLHLSEKELKSLLNKTIDKMQQDEVLKDMIRDQLHFGLVSNAPELDPMLEQNMKDLVNEFEDGLD